MYERGDFLVVHEPFSRVCDFGVAEVDHRTCRSQEDVMAALVELAAEQPVFFKDTTDFHFDRLGAQLSFVKRCRHATMVRNPPDTVRSHLRMQSDATSRAMGFQNLWEIVSTVASSDLPIHIVDGDQVVEDPEGEMKRYCEAMGIAFMADSLTFRKEPPASWGTTGRWHEGASESSALGVAPGERNELSEELERTVEAYVRDQEPYYDLIMAMRKKHGWGAWR
jgi:adenylylsulfate kinase